MLKLLILLVLLILLILLKYCLWLRYIERRHFRFLNFASHFICFQLFQIGFSSGIIAQIFCPIST